MNPCTKKEDSDVSITCLIVDDEPLAVQLLENHVAQVPFLSLKGCAYHSMEALTFLEKQPVDLIFLDINLPYLSGMQLKDLLLPDQKVIFTTAYSEFAVESYEKNAVDYLLKPVTFERFLKAVLKVKKAEDTPGKFSDLPGSIFVKSGKELLKVAIDDILYIEGLKDYVLVVTDKQRIITYKRLKDLEQTLPGQFSRVHLSYIVNHDKIQRVADNHVVIGNVQIPLSEKYRAGFLQKVYQKLL